MIFGAHVIVFSKDMEADLHRCRLSRHAWWRAPLYLLGNMIGRMIVRVLLLLVAGLVYGQDKPARLTFEVASVKPSKPGGRGGAMKVLPGGQQFVAQSFPLRQMIARMHLVPPRQVTSGPDWMDSELWDIQAKADRPGYTREQMLEMLGSMLEDEFKLKLRKDAKEGPVYALTIDRSGLKMKVNDSPEDYEIPVQGGGPGGITVGKRVAMDRLCFTRGSFLQNNERPVTGKTGLSGYYDFTLSFLPELPPGFDKERLPPEMQARPSLFDAVRSQLGLKLEATKGAVESIYVVEHIGEASGELKETWNFCQVDGRIRFFDKSPRLPISKRPAMRID